MILMRAGQTAKKESVWERTRYQHLFRYVPSGTIFAWFKIAGKQVRKSLKTKNQELAKSKLAELERNERAVGLLHQPLSFRHLHQDGIQFLNEIR